MNDRAVSADGRLAARRDLVLVPATDGAVVKDPLSLEYFRLGERETFLLEALRTPTTLSDLTRAFQRRYPNERATPPLVLGFCSTLAQSGLLLVDRHADRSRQKAAGAPWWQSLLSPLALRLPGVDPTPLLRPLAPLAAVMFSTPFAVVLVVGFAVVAIGWMGRSEEALAELDRLQGLFAPQHALLVAVAVIVTKAWHELGHALACRRLGAECHEAGVLLLVFLPSLYCDVTDAWTLPSRRRRALVALAGVYFEAALAVVAAGAWLVLAPGPLRTLAFYLVGVATVSTLLVNLNPLLRFDGYYVLADAWGVPNLREQSRAALGGPLRRWVQGERGDAPQLDASPPLLAAYGLASTLYGLALLATILWFLHRQLAEAGFAVAGDLVVALTGMGLLFGSAVGARRLLTGPAPGRRVGAALRALIVVVVAIAAGCAILNAPLEQTLLAPCRVESEAFADVVARSAGLLEPRARYGDRVEAGDLLAELVDDEATLRGFELAERRAALEAELSGLRTRAASDAGLLAEIARLEPLLAEVRRQGASHAAQTERRRLRSPLAGRVERPASRRDDRAAETPEGELVTWTGAPLDGPNRGCWLEVGDPVCRVLGPGLQAILLLGEDECGLVETGDPVRVALDRSPGEALQGLVASVALAAADERLTEPERLAEGSLRSPLERGAVYRVTVTLSALPTAEWQPGAAGQARIVTGDETLGGRLLRWLRRLVRFG